MITDNLNPTPSGALISEIFICHVVYTLSIVLIKDLYYLDCTGYFLYFINKFFFKEEVYPSNFKILIWDKLFTPFTIILDKIINYKFGKNVMCVIEKN